MIEKIRKVVEEALGNNYSVDAEKVADAVLFHLAATDKLGLLTENERLKAGLKFYADGTHYQVRMADVDDGPDDAWNESDPDNWVDNSQGDMVETGHIAKKILEGWSMPPGGLKDEGDTLIAPTPTED